MAVAIVMPAEGPVLRDRALGHVDVDVVRLEEIVAGCSSSDAWARA